MDPPMTLSPYLPAVLRLLHHMCWTYWVLSILGALLADSLVQMHGFITYGKARSPDEPQSGVYSLTVPKRYFTYFYVLGTGWTLLLLFTDHFFLNKSLNDALLIILAHIVYRLREEALAPPSQARMHIIGFLVGMSFYLVAPLTLMAPWDEHDKSNQHGSLSLQTLIGYLLLGYAQIHQARCHNILHALKRQGRYGLPQGDWFEYVAAPHYLAEILFYLGLVLIAPTPLVLVQWGFVLTNLCVSGRRSYDYYQAHFAREFRTKWAVIPFVY